MSGSYVLIQFGNDPFNLRFEDLEGRPAFAICQLDLQAPNAIVKVAREPSWSQHHPEVMGPSNAFLYFGPSKTPGYLAYGNDPTTHPMVSALKQKKDTSNSRYFHAQNGKEFKWRLGPQRMECLSGSTIVAVWETGSLSSGIDSRMTIKQAGLPTVTEIMTTFALNRIAQALNWPVALQRIGNTSP
ncbi:hypothetical protein PUNSTDRAFT_142896 [Punctularia strigosozonata HHB-11173 SS5]|uniref:uncharacterized protein n=1 Tax=Punctularia strigosozonata (strain HHB-11173) TaxID=741275 RepID=UPI0004418122|nr:uncharacterized protein PUNSTDRAFT_142896 [Punctularia strigosozonata HHB-11173 SS5]EIN11032.1 hypothetical protein PUNSTDRAFT_142896 [Punctularia strigosozonata HHB-11173 SS5]